LFFISLFYGVTTEIRFFSWKTFKKKSKLNSYFMVR